MEKQVSQPIESTTSSPVAEPARDRHYRAVMLPRIGGPEVLRIVDLPLPEPGPTQLRVRIRAAGVGSTDLMMLAGRYNYAPPMPFVPGYEIAGVVDAVGTDVKGFQVGQRVAALTLHGGFAEYMVRDAEHFIPIPDGVSDVQASAAVLNYVTAWQMIHRFAKVRPGQTALVTGAAGGVGTAVLQLLRLAGVKAYGAASPAKHDIIRKFGATPLDYREGRLDRLMRAREPKGVDVVFDAIGGSNVTPCIKALRAGGMLVGFGFMNVESKLAILASVANTLLGARLRGRRGAFYGITLLYRKDPKPLREDLPKIFALIEDGSIDPLIDAVFPFASAREALERLAAGKGAGKIVLTVS
jgi:NADPH:quinone reductase-like Zn-dependent oxidoreductase